MIIILKWYAASNAKPEIAVFESTYDGLKLAIHHVIDCQNEGMTVEVYECNNDVSPMVTTLI